MVGLVFREGDMLFWFFMLFPFALFSNSVLGLVHPELVCWLIFFSFLSPVFFFFIYFKFKSSISFSGGACSVQCRIICSRAEVSIFSEGLTLTCIVCMALTN